MKRLWSVDFLSIFENQEIWNWKRAKFPKFLVAFYVVDQEEFFDFHDLGL